MSRYDKYSSQAMDILKTVQEIVRKEHRSETNIEDLSKAILLSAIPDLLLIAKENNAILDKQKLKALVNTYDTKAETGTGTIKLAESVRNVLDEAEKLAGKEAVQPEHIIHAAWPTIKDSISPYFEFADEGPVITSVTVSSPKIDAESPPSSSPSVGTSVIDEAARAAALENFTRDIDTILREAEADAQKARAGTEGGGGSLSQRILGRSQELELPPIPIAQEKSQALAFLNTIARELTAKDRIIDVFGRDEEIDNLVSILGKYFKPNPLILGDPGVGKTAIVEGLADRVRKGNVPPSLKNVKIFELRISELQAGTSVHGAFEEKMKDLIKAVETDPSIIIFIDEMHQIAPSYGQEPTADILKPALSRGKFRCIGATTVADYHRYLEKDDALTRRFQTVLIKEPDLKTVRIILDGLKPRLESHYKINISEAMLDRAIQISGQHISQRSYPDKAIDALDRACSRAFFKGETVLTEKHLREAVTDIAGVTFEDDLSDTSGLKSLETKIKRDIKGQEHAISSVCNVLRICKKHLDLRQERPDGVFLFTGPTGVGKTALAESLAHHLSGKTDAITRIDMSEFSESHSIARLIGSPPGYIGYGDMALLPQACEKNPSGVLLLDEFEKAHPQVHRLFLQVFDSGRIKDSYGKTLSFANMTIIATCNVNDENKGDIGFNPNSQKEQAKVPMAKLKQVFPIELLNRFDEIVPFRPLNREDIEVILASILEVQVNKNLSSEYGINLEFSKEARNFIIDAGFSEEFGARKLQRAFQDLVIRPLSEHVDNLEKNTKYQVLLKEDTLTFEK